MLDRPPADKLPHHGIAGKSVGVVDILVSGKARKDRLAEEARKSVPAVASCPGIGDQPCRHVQQTEGVVEFPVQ